MPLGASDAGVRIAHYVAQDWIDDGQIGTTTIHQDINFAQSRIYLQSLLLSHSWSPGGRIYAAITHSLAVNRGCGSSLLIDCGQFPEGYVSAHHDQRVSAAAGLYLPTPRGDGAGCRVRLRPLIGRRRLVPFRLTLDADLGRTIAKNVSLELVARNLFDDRYAITLDSSLQGTHYARPRSVELRLSIVR